MNMKKLVAVLLIIVTLSYSTISVRAEHVTLTVAGITFTLFKSVLLLPLSV